MSTITLLCTDYRMLEPSLAKSLDAFCGELCRPGAEYTWEHAYDLNGGGGFGFTLLVNGQFKMQGEIRSDIFRQGN